MKTTLYLPDELKSAVEVSARRRGISDAEFDRQALAEAVERGRRPDPRWGILPSRGGPGSSDVASHVDEVLAEGFGTG
ncbi:MAG: CopG family transcriptional regulator [Phycicoccus sp.]